jgi:hypothetical protein
MNCCTSPLRDRFALPVALGYQSTSGGFRNLPNLHHQQKPGKTSLVASTYAGEYAGEPSRPPPIFKWNAVKRTKTRLKKL